MIESEQYLLNIIKIIANILTFDNSSFFFVENKYIIMYHMLIIACA